MKAGITRLTLITISLAGLAGFLALLLGQKTHPAPQFKLSKCKPFVGLKPSFSEDVTKSTLVFKKDFFSPQFQKSKFLREENLGFALPLFLTKDKKWLVSYKSFLFTPQGRAEIAHLSLKDIQELFGRPLLLTEVLERFPKKTLFLIINTRNPERAFKNLKFIYARKNTLINSENEELILALSRETTVLSLVHSFRNLVRFQLMNLLGLSGVLPLSAQGILVPSYFALSQKTVRQLKSQEKNLYLEIKNSLQDISPSLQPFLSGILTENIDQGMQFIQNKKSSSCLRKI